MKKFELLVATICLIGCVEAVEAADLVIPTEPIGGSQSRVENSWDVCKERLLQAVDVIAAKDYKGRGIAACVKSFESQVRNMLVKLFEDADFKAAYDAGDADFALKAALSDLIRPDGAKQKKVARIYLNGLLKWLVEDESSGEAEEESES